MLLLYKIMWDKSILKGKLVVFHLRNDMKLIWTCGNFELGILQYIDILRE